MEDSLRVLGKYTLLLDNKDFDATAFFRFRDTVQLDVVNQVHIDPESIRVKILLALRDGRPLVIDCKGIEENLVKLFDTVQQGLFLAMATVGGPWYTTKDYVNLIVPDDLEVLGISNNGTFEAKEGFSLLIILRSVNPAAVLLDNFAVVKVCYDVFKKPLPPYTDLRNPPGLEVNKKKKKPKPKSNLY